MNNVKNDCHPSNMLMKHKKKYKENKSRAYSYLKDAFNLSGEFMTNFVLVPNWKKQREQQQRTTNDSCQHQNWQTVQLAIKKSKTHPTSTSNQVKNNIPNPLLPSCAGHNAKQREQQKQQTTKIIKTTCCVCNKAWATIGPHKY